MTKKKKIVKWVTNCFYIIFIPLCSCATLFNSDQEYVNINTDPTNALVTVNGEKYYTPATVVLPRNTGNYVVSVERQGYKSEQIILENSLDAPLFVNLLLPGWWWLIGLVVDVAGNRIYDFEPETIFVNMKKETQNGERAEMR